MSQRRRVWTREPYRNADAVAAESGWQCRGVFTSIHVDGVGHYAVAHHAYRRRAQHHQIGCLARLDRGRRQRNETGDSDEPHHSL